jgi:hypothetical protein
MFVILVIAAYTASLAAIFLAYKPSMREVPFDSFDELTRQSHVRSSVCNICHCSLHILTFTFTCLEILSETAVLQLWCVCVCVCICVCVCECVSE